MAPFDRLRTGSFWRSMVTIATYCIISEIKRYFYTPAFNAPVMGFPSYYFIKICYGQARMVWLSDGETSLRIWLLVLNATDGRTDRQTPHNCIGRADAKIVAEVRFLSRVSTAMCADARYWYIPVPIRLHSIYGRILCKVRYWSKTPFYTLFHLNCKITKHLDFFFKSLMQTAQVPKLGLLDGTEYCRKVQPSW